MAAQSRYEILIETDAELTALKETQADLQQQAKIINEVGGASEELETKLAAVNKEIGARKLSLYTQDLREMIAAENAAGNATAALEQKLHSVESSTSSSKLTSSFGNLQSAAKDFFETIEAGAGIAIGEKIISGLESIGEELVDVAKKGVEFDKEMETLGLGLAGALRQADPTRYLNFAEAQQAGTAAIKSIRDEANKLGIDARSLGEALQVNIKALSEGGITDLNQQVETTGLLLQAAASKGVSGFQALRDIIDIINGNADRTILSKELGVTDDDIANAKEAGDLYGYLVDKLGAYKEAGQVAAQSLAGLETIFENLKSTIEGEAAAPIFDAIKEFYAESVQFLKDHPQLGEEFRSIAAAIVNWLQPLGAALKMLADIGESVAYAASWWLKVTGQADEATRAVKVHIETLDEVKARVQGTADAQAKVTAETNRLGFALDDVAEKATKVKAAVDDTAKSIADWEKGYSKASDASQKLAEQIKQTDFAKLDPQHQLAALNQDVQGVIDKLRALGVDAKTPADALAQMSNYGADAQLKIAALVEKWLKLNDAQTKASDTVKKGAEEEAKAKQKTLADLDAQIAKLREITNLSGQTAATPAPPSDALQKQIDDATAKLKAGDTNYAAVLQQLTDQLQAQRDALAKATPPAPPQTPTTPITPTSPAGLPNAQANATQGQDAAAKALNNLSQAASDSFGDVATAAEDAAKAMPGAAQGAISALSALPAEIQAALGPLAKAGADLGPLIEQLSATTQAGFRQSAAALQRAQADLQNQIDSLWNYV